ncbi:MAG: ABC transporter permease [Blastocatellia bacterium]|nr:ABC transporter permease [Blastocatellia bacterium]
MLNKLRLRLRALFFKPKMEDELQAELQFHLEREIEENIARGMTAEEARYAALRSFGGVERVKEESRDARGVRFLEEVWQDLRYGARMLLKNPGFTLIAALTLALGIGANTAIFSVIDATLFHPLPFEKLERLMSIKSAGYLLNLFPETDGGEFMSWREPVNVFESVAAYESGRANLSDEYSPERIQIMQVTPGFFPLLRAQPSLGRWFTDGEVKRGETRLLILTYGLWRRRFGGDENLLGKQVRLNGTPFTVIGVAPSRFGYEDYGDKPEAFIPLLPNDHLLAKEAFIPAVIGRLKDGVTQAQAQAELNAIGERLTRLKQEEAARNPEKRFGGRVEISLQPLVELFVGNLRQPLLILLGAVACVLLIACANVANLLLARALNRSPEIAVRAALGASRWRLMRQWLTESLLLALAGGAAGLLMAGWIVDALTKIYPEPLTKLGAPGIDARALLFTLAVTLLTGLLFGCAPALQFSRPDLTTALKEGGAPGAAGVAPRLRKILLVGEVALTLALLIGAGLLVKSFWRMLGLRAGFRAEQVLTLELSPAPGKYADPERLAALYQQVIERVGALPGVRIVGASNHLPMSITEGILLSPLKVIGRGDFDIMIGGTNRIASEDYFRALNIPLREGRFFDGRDTAQSPRVMIVNESLAKKAFPNESPIGKLVGYGGGDSQYEIVGVVGDSDFMGMGGNLGQEIYRPLRQRPPGALRLAILTSDDPAAMTGAVRDAVSKCDPDLPVYNVKTMTQIVAEASARRRFATLSLGAFALIGLLLSSLGVYGVMSYIIERRTHEIGVRMALGARAGDVLKLALWQGMKPILIGMPIGMAAALGLAILLADLLYGVRPIDPPTFMTVPLSLALVALLACWIPARRAMKVDPLVTLRRE